MLKIVFRLHVTIFTRCHGANRQVLIDLHQQLLIGNKENKFAIISKIKRLCPDECETVHHGRKSTKR